jgi:hypothetical protein
LISKVDSRQDLKSDIEETPVLIDHIHTAVNAAAVLADVVAMAISAGLLYRALMIIFLGSCHSLIHTMSDLLSA